MSQPEPCVHYWLIGTLADLPRDQGRCKLCGAVKTFAPEFIDVSYSEYHHHATKTYQGPEREIISYMAESMREG